MAQMRLLQTEVKGNFNKTETWLRKLLKLDVQNVLDKYGKVGVEALSRATPRRTGRTAESWSYSTEVTRGANGKVASASITWFNSNTTASNSTKNIPIVILIEYGHGTRRGKYVPPHPFVSDSLKPVFDDIYMALWKEVKNA